MTKVHEEKKNLDGKDKSQGDLVDGGALETPEGLKRESAYGAEDPVSRIGLRIIGHGRAH
jgi:hypothetical protein